MADVCEAVTFQLDFNASGWSTEDAVRWIFLGELAAAEGGEEWEVSVSSVLAGLESTDQELPERLWPDQQDLVANVVRFMHKLGPSVLGSDLPPIVWSRLAIQYWLHHGGCHHPFMNAFGDWLNELGHVDVRVANRRKPKSNAGGRSLPTLRGKAAQLSMAAFLLELSPASHFGRRQVKVVNKQATRAMPQKVSVADRDVALKKMLGANLYDTIRSVIDDAISSGSIPKLSRKTDLKSGRFTYSGVHGELCQEICRCYRQETEKYKQSTLDRAIRAFVVSRKSWPAGTRGRAG